MLSQQLVQKQTQKLTMTAELRQSIELLPLSTLELAEKINAELIENPVLEEVYNPDKSRQPEQYSNRENIAHEKRELEKSKDISFNDIYNLERTTTRYDTEASDRNQNFIESSPLRKKLSDYLLEQIRFLNLNDEEFHIAEILISMIDEKGFIPKKKVELSSELNIEIPKIKRVIKQIQNLDPIGIGARNIKETLYIQSKILKPDEPKLHELIKNHFQDLEKLDYKKISKQMSLSEEKVEQLAKLVKKLEPFPASLFVSRRADYIIPDLIINEREGEFSIYINDDWIPKISINKDYKAVLIKSCSQEEKEFIETKISSAKWLIKSISQRRQTLFKVMNSIIEFQIDFFKSGIEYLKPLTLKDIADKLSMHESTISRITSKKYAQTSWGIYELKWFFSSGVKSQDGGKESSKKIHDIIRTLVREESDENPLSDQDIVDIMQKKGIEIARRTVAKYRKILKILPSNRRKKIRELKD